MGWNDIVESLIDPVNVWSVTFFLILRILLFCQTEMLGLKIEVRNCPFKRFSSRLWVWQSVLLSVMCVGLLIQGLCILQLPVGAHQITELNACLCSVMCSALSAQEPGTVTSYVTEWKSLLILLLKSCFSH